LLVAGEAGERPLVVFLESAIEGIVGRGWGTWVSLDEMGIREGCAYVSQWVRKMIERICSNNRYENNPTGSNVGETDD